MVLIESSGITDVGKKRKGNEDELLINDDLGLYIVADGMGGHQAGEVASKMVVDIVQDYIIQVNNGDTPEKLENSDETLSRDANNLLSGILLANRSIFDVSGSDGNLKGAMDIAKKICPESKEFVVEVFPPMVTLMEYKRYGNEKDYVDFIEGYLKGIDALWPQEDIRSSAYSGLVISLSVAQKYNIEHLIKKVKDVKKKFEGEGDEKSID